ncbi:MAG: hypothetical protein LUD27_01890 [Clostridia bacterium]|nr:hypothetical protein [Clostridia bacterium]
MTQKEFEDLKAGDSIAANCDDYAFTTKSSNWTGKVLSTDSSDKSIEATTVTPETMWGFKFDGLQYEDFDVIKEA